MFPGTFHLKFKWIDLEVGLGCNSLFGPKHIRGDSYEPLQWQQAMGSWGCDFFHQHSQALEEAVCPQLKPQDKQTLGWWAESM